MSDSPARQQPIKPHHSWQRLTMKSIDALGLVLGLYCLVTWQPEVDSKSTIVIGLVAVGIFNFSGELVGLYRNWRGIPFANESLTHLMAGSLTLVFLFLLGTLSLYSTELSGWNVATWMLFATLFALNFRMIRRWIFFWRQRNSVHTRKYAVVGVNDLGIQLVQNVNRSPDLGLNFLGYYDDRPDDRTSTLPDEIDIKLGKLDSLIEAAHTGEVQVIFITLPMRAEDRIRGLIQALADTTASVYIVPDLFVFQMLNSRWTDVQGLPVVSVFESPLFGVDGVLKRSVDVALASTALVLGAIPMLLIAAAVKWTSPGPILFRQKRYGLDGREISVWKFRSMTVQENGAEVRQAIRNDQRLTSIGGFLRRTSLDELPQIINVLLGQMSLVGPRPHANAHNEYYRQQIDGYMLRHKVKPGITGLAQVNGCRGETETVDKMERRIHFDHQYIREWSIWLDLKIILNTFTVVLSRQNAY